MCRPNGHWTLTTLARFIETTAFQFEITINIFVSFFLFHQIPMLRVYGLFGMGINFRTSESVKPSPQSTIWLVYCWANFLVDGQLLCQHWANDSCFQICCWLRCSQHLNLSIINCHIYSFAWHAMCLKRGPFFSRYMCHQIYRFHESYKITSVSTRNTALPHSHTKGRIAIDGIAYWGCEWEMGIKKILLKSFIL